MRSDRVRIPDPAAKPGAPATPGAHLPAFDCTHLGPKGGRAVFRHRRARDRQRGARSRQADRSAGGSSRRGPDRM